ncbi:MAG: metallophosphoesterase [Rhizonema sp. PD37]|nr:metallophosphoesterase [Rhizonema sp. PD37]
MRKILLTTVFLLVICVTFVYVLSTQRVVTSAPKLLTDPFLQLPTESSVRVVWFTEFAGSKHIVKYGQNNQQTAVTTTKLSRTREDQQSHVGNQTKEAEFYHKPVMRDIWRHEAEVVGLTPGKRVPYSVTSVREDGESVSSNVFTLAAKPTPGTPLKILLTSDHQLKPMIAANLQKVVQTVGQVDAVFFAGDLVDIADRASEWFDDNRGGAFFPCLQGSAKHETEFNGVKTTYTGGKIIQYAPMFTSIGNHEVMGRFGKSDSIGGEFGDTIPRAVAKKLYGEKSLEDNSFNTKTYEEILSLPESKEGRETYYAVSFGDVRLIVLYAANMWRTPNLDAAKGKYQETKKDLKNPLAWGYGQHIYEPIGKGSKQYNWLVQELNSPEFKTAKYKVVMLHYPPHSLGDNIVPPYTNPVPLVERDANQNITSVRYQYPKNADYIIRDVQPLLEAARVQLVFYGHSHLWNRFRNQSGMNFLETSNVGNTYGAFFGNNKRKLLPIDKDYVEVGDPNALEPVTPTITQLLGDDGKPLPYIASNEITVFSIFDTGTGKVSSYRFDTRQPVSEVIKFDEFKL